jgi:hypothetical protein
VRGEGRVEKCQCLKSVESVSVSAEKGGDESERACYFAD